MSDTPETDKNTWSDSSEGILYKVVSSDFARKLERERNEAREKYDTLAVENMLEVNKICKERDEWAAMCGRYKQERDEARVELEMWRDGNIMHQIHKDELEKTERERDEAREQVNHYRDKLDLSPISWEL